jgi:hypothetical protein
MFAKFSPHGTRVAYVHDNDIHVEIAIFSNCSSPAHDYDT